MKHNGIRPDLRGIKMQVASEASRSKNILPVIINTDFWTHWTSSVQSKDESVVANWLLTPVLTPFNDFIS